MDAARGAKKLHGHKPSDPEQIRILILAEPHLYSWALAQFLSGRKGLRVVGVSGDVVGALDGLGELRPDIALIDMGTANSAVAVRRIAAELPNLKIIAFAISNDERDLAACVRARVAGYVSIEEDPEALVVTIESVARGEMHCSSRIAGAVLDRVAALAAEQAQDPIDIPLTTRELEVLELIDQGLSNKEIAFHLSIEVATVKNHVHNILGKLKVHRRTQAVARLRQ